MKNHILEARNKLGGKEIPEMITKIEEKSQKDRVLTSSKTMWMLTSWHKTLVPALGS